MTMPLYVSPEQAMKDRADFARHGIARGRSVAVLRYGDGIVFVAENHSATLHKISEIYDRIGFAGVGRYNEFESLRVAGIRHADMRGYAYDRSDVSARGLAHAYAQLLGGSFSSGTDKPFEIELIVAELGTEPTADALYRISFDGSLIDEPGYAAMGGRADDVAAALAATFDPTATCATALQHTVAALSGENEPLTSATLEVAVLDRTSQRPRCFRRIDRATVAEILGER
ncbi:MAG: proteasome subunit alpha [Propionibacteriaceae bacterium]